MIIKSCVFFQALLPYINVSPYVSDASVEPTSQVRSSVMLVLPIAGN
jgi:hypothetical protein